MLYRPSGGGQENSLFFHTDLFTVSHLVVTSNSETPEFEFVELELHECLSAFDGLQFFSKSTEVV
eukprot:m.53056 g.53056  ORF g.53056 m.53056 type:complete len:65 (-) comp10838_c0_seq3:152-346(-)